MKFKSRWNCLSLPFLCHPTRKWPANIQIKGEHCTNSGFFSPLSFNNLFFAVWVKNGTVFLHGRIQNATFNHPTRNWPANINQQNKTPAAPPHTLLQYKFTFYFLCCLSHNVDLHLAPEEKMVRSCPPLLTSKWCANIHRKCNIFFWVTAVLGKRQGTPQTGCYHMDVRIWTVNLLNLTVCNQSVIILYMAKTVQL